MKVLWGKKKQKQKRGITWAEKEIEILTGESGKVTEKVAL